MPSRGALMQWATLVTVAFSALARNGAGQWGRPGSRSGYDAPMTCQVPPKLRIPWPRADPGRPLSPA